MAEQERPAEPRPLLSVVKGSPTAEELAALTAVVAVSRSSASDEDGAPTPTSRWAAYWRGTRRPLRPGPDGWRASARPGAF